MPISLNLIGALQDWTADARPFPEESVAVSLFLPNPVKEPKGTLLGTLNREPQECSRYIIGIYLPGSLYSIIFLVYSCGSLFGVPSRLPLEPKP